MMGTTYCWETRMFQWSNEPIYRTLYGETLLEAVKARGDSHLGLNPEWFEGRFDDGSPYVTVISDDGLQEVFIVQSVWQVDEDDIRSSFAVFESQTKEEV